MALSALYKTVTEYLIFVKLCKNYCNIISHKKTDSQEQPFQCLPSSAIRLPPERYSEWMRDESRVKTSAKHVSKMLVDSYPNVW